MSRFNFYTTENAPDESKEFLGQTKKRLGFIPNILAGMAESSNLLEGYLALSQIFDKTSFTETERQIILMTNNRLNNCKYCMAAHSTIANRLGVPKNIIISLRKNNPLEDSKLEALRVFAVKVNKTKGSVNEGDINEFLSAGYTEKNVLEIIIGTALKVLSNYTNHIIKTPTDEAFKDWEWGN